MNPDLWPAVAIAGLMLIMLGACFWLLAWIDDERSNAFDAYEAADNELEATYGTSRANERHWRDTH
jgi:hypothetical protein